ncbi:DUF805 domain-containing protein [Curtobacterium sp. VKM Ac-2884]|uniref:DUF805 domain-containing protein n=1 Tax=Curtobacterium sp. VKM Ac-2884 TaxID=2783818 RepID=UPI00188A7DC7|nr:DUF805 domain-containing protein [Curtobacterium sp. VKM Ac-2884]MBF4604018.1 DUF805 domain-containing protein [Curtobacterium sp. VKM Ac-2884]
MSFWDAVRCALRRFGDFTGIATRPEFWWFALFVALGDLALNSMNIVTNEGTTYLGASLSGVFGVATILPLLAVAVRRLRDAGRAWPELFWLLLPIAGVIVLAVHLANPRWPQMPQPAQYTVPEPLPADG